jgi:hypothetical protein
MNATEKENFYRSVLVTLQGAKIPFLVGGAYAFSLYTGIYRDTKDLDLFVRKRDCESLLKIMSELGYQTEIIFSHWLGKIHSGDMLVDVIFSSGNGICEVDEAWFENAVDGEILGIPVLLTAAEEMIWSKGFVMERHRYDGADIAHLLHACSETMDWSRLLGRFAEHWRVLLSHLILFGFVYPAEQSKIPARVMEELLARLNAEISDDTPKERYCQGTFLSLMEYLVDVNRWGYKDARLIPRGKMTSDQIERWTLAFIK